jgi:Fe2+ transport system protein FeoA
MPDVPAQVVASAEVELSEYGEGAHDSELQEGLTTLDRLSPMQVAVVERIDALVVDAARLKRLGICEGRRVQLVKADDPLIVRVVGTRVGISAQLSPAIHVRPCRSENKSGQS